MKPIVSYSDKPLREEQFGVFIDLLSLMESRDDIEFLIDSTIMESEKAYICQRLNILRMLAKSFSYSQISDKLGVPPSTISNANKILEFGGERLKKLLLGYKYKESIKSSSKTDRRKAGPHYPGAIRI